MATNPILDELEKARAAVVALRSEMSRVAGDLKVAEARLDAFEIAAKAFDAAAPRASKSLNVKQTRNRLPNAGWQAVFQTLYNQFGNDFGYDDVVNAAAMRGMHDVKKASLRTKMMNYVEVGYVVRTGAGQFAVTDKGVPYFKIEAEASKENEPRSDTARGPDAGSEAAATAPKPWFNS